MHHSAALLLVLLAVPLGCVNGPAQVEPTGGGGRPTTPEALTERQRRSIDTAMGHDLDGDGVLSREEFPSALFSVLDENGDGGVDRGEVTALIVEIARPFRWVNPPDADRSGIGVTHHTFTSSLLETEVGYNIYLPPGYHDEASRNERYPVVYYQCGGRPGTESLDVGLAELLHPAIAQGQVRPVIYVWFNGGPSNLGDSQAGDVLVRELIPHVDATYRTVARRGGRALQGFSMGGRGVTRLGFGHPELFASMAPGGPAYQVEKRTREHGGVEYDPRFEVFGLAEEHDFGVGSDAYSRAEAYAGHPTDPPLAILIWGGTEGFNYRGILEYLDFLSDLGIPAEHLFVPGIGHDSHALFASRGIELLRFHERHWER